MCPSPPPFGIGLGPTNPSLINIAKETLIFRRAWFSHAMRLLVPTFSLLYAPPWVIPSASLQNRTLSYRFPFTNERKAPSFGIILSPDHLRRKISEWVSCYAIFKGWLPLSQPPHCQRNLTSLSALSMNFGTLTWDLGCFPFEHRSLAPWL